MIATVERPVPASDAVPVIVVVGLKFGVFTPTEAAVVAAVYALLIAVFSLAPQPLSSVAAAAAKGLFP